MDRYHVHIVLKLSARSIHYHSTIHVLHIKMLRSAVLIIEMRFNRTLAHYLAVTKELVQMMCPHCRLHFCLQHRHQVDHRCEKYEKPKETMVKTSELVSQIVAKTLEKKPVRQGVKSAQLAAKVQLMKLKQNSKGLKQLPIGERAYFLIKLPLEKKDEAVYVSHLWSVGKCIDSIASLCEVPNNNNNSVKPQLNLYSSPDSCVSNRKDVSIKNLFENETLYNGQSLWLKYDELEK